MKRIWSKLNEKILAGANKLMPLEDTQSGEECYIKGSNTKPSIKDMQLHDF
jgi:hypothetical protein